MAFFYIKIYLFILQLHLKAFFNQLDLQKVVCIFLAGYPLSLFSLFKWSDINKSRFVLCDTNIADLRILLAIAVLIYYQKY